MTASEGPVAGDSATVDAWCCQATLHGPERLHMAGYCPCASAVRVWPTVDAVPCAVNSLNMVPANTTYASRTVVVSDRNRLLVVSRANSEADRRVNA